MPMRIRDPRGNPGGMDNSINSKAWRHHDDGKVRMRSGQTGVGGNRVLELGFFTVN